jgi:hypothetical protein
LAAFSEIWNVIINKYIPVLKIIKYDLQHFFYFIKAGIS